MTLGAVVALTLLELEDEDLLALVLVDHGCGDLLALEGLGIDDGLVVFGKHQNIEVTKAIECFYKSAELGREVRAADLK